MATNRSLHMGKTLDLLKSGRIIFTEHRCIFVKGRSGGKSNITHWLLCEDGIGSERRIHSKAFDGLLNNGYIEIFKISEYRTYYKYHNGCSQ